MGIIRIEQMSFYAYHGCFRDERLTGSRFLVDLEMSADLETAVESDDLNDTLDYQLVYNTVNEQMKIKSHLLENVAGRILDNLFNKFPEIEKATVKVSKLNPLVGGDMHCVSVTLSR